MSVLIKGMKKPFECLQCPFWTMYITPRKPIDVCLASDKKPIDCADLRPDWCPIVYIPEKHGRLIDADALLKKFCGHCDGYEECGTNKIRVECYDLGLINHSPTIIEAEVPDA